MKKIHIKMLKYICFIHFCDIIVGNMFTDSNVIGGKVVFKSFMVKVLLLDLSVHVLINRLWY